MAQICYHKIDHDGHSYYCSNCNKSLQEKNMGRVSCPQCEHVFMAEENSGVTCPNCDTMFEAFERLLLPEDYGKQLASKIKLEMLEHLQIHLVNLLDNKFRSIESEKTTVDEFNKKTKVKFCKNCHQYTPPGWYNLHQLCSIVEHFNMKGWLEEYEKSH